MKSTEELSLPATGTNGLPAAPTSKPRSARTTLIVVGALSVGLLALVGVRVKQAGQKREGVTKQAEAALASNAERDKPRVVRPVPGTWRPVVEVTGTLRPIREADLGFQAQGRLSQVLVHAGDRVKAGQLLAVLDASMAAAQVAQAQSQIASAEANLRSAEDNFKRTSALVASKALPEAQLEQSRAALDAAKGQAAAAHAGATAAKVGAGQNALVAPFDGLVKRAPTGVGGYVNPMMSTSGIVQLEDVSRLRLAGSVAEGDVQFLKVGNKVRVAYQGRDVEGHLTTIVPSLDPATRRAPVEVEVDNADNGILAWSFVRARLEGTGEVPVLKLPATAKRPGSQDEIVVVQDGKAKLVHVVMFADDDGTLVVRSGLEPDVQVLAAPSDDVRTGKTLDVVAEGAPREVPK